QVSAYAFCVDDLEHVLGGERLKVKTVGGVVIGRDGLRITIDHDRFEACLLQRERGVAATIIELDALTDAVWSAAEDDHLLPVRWRGFRGSLSGKRCLVGRVHVGGRGGEFGGAGVDALEYRPDGERVPALRDFRRRQARETAEPRVGKTHRLETAKC